jgi:dipeptidyl aminopeptidase/acylaminoacyl peptidase
VEPYDLPFDSIEVRDEEIGFGAFGARWTCRLSDYLCRRVDARSAASPVESVSPDGRWVAFRRGHDLWLRSAETGEESALTTNGTAEYGYATVPDYAARRQALRALGVRESPVVVSWSPDSLRLLTYRLDQRGVGSMHLVEAAPPDGGRPRLHSYRYPLPGQTRPRGEWRVFDVRTRAEVPARTEPFCYPYRAPLSSGLAWWSADAKTVYLLDQPRDLRTLWLKALDAVTGEVRTLVKETGATRVEPTQDSAQRPMVRVLSDGAEALWCSQRDGWGHLYLYDLHTGQVVTQVTKGDFAVQAIAHVDEAERVAYLVVSGLVDVDPYRRSLVKVCLDGTGFARLTDDDLDHVVSVPPHGEWFVDSASTVDAPPVTTVRSRDGSVSMELERADVSRLMAAGWSPPERFRAIAADGKTPVYGVLYKPFGFDARRTYPVVDHPYPGPQTGRVKPCFDPGWYGYDAEAVAALGFVVVAVDGRGTPGRDKNFHDFSYRNMGSAGGMDDHVAALRQLAETRQWMDLDRVGIFGLSGGGFATVRAMLTFPEFYKVGVAEAGNHDNRFFVATWAETYDGPCEPDHEANEANEANDTDVAARLSNIELADNLIGRLLLVHGEMDEGVSPQLTLRLVDRLVAADKDFDLLIVPGAEHTFIGYQHYVIRRRWDFLVRHLLRKEPPAYRLAPVPVDPDVRAFILGG